MAASQPQAESSVLNEIHAAARQLREDLDAYFTAPHDALDIDIKLLSPTHVRPTGVANALSRMTLAAQGAHPKRAPVTVTAGEGRFRVVDGNSTYAVATMAGWRKLRCQLEKI